MKKYTKLGVASKITNQKTGEVVQCVKYRKDGTKRVFFAPECNGKRLTTTLWARLADAEKVARLYLNR